MSLEDYPEITNTILISWEHQMLLTLDDEAFQQEQQQYREDIHHGREAKRRVHTSNLGTAVFLSTPQHVFLLLFNAQQ